MRRRQEDGPLWPGMSSLFIETWYGLLTVETDVGIAATTGPRMVQVPSFRIDEGIVVGFTSFRVHPREFQNADLLFTADEAGMITKTRITQDVF